MEEFANDQLQYISVANSWPVKLPFLLSMEEFANNQLQDISVTNFLAGLLTVEYFGKVKVKETIHWLMTSLLWLIVIDIE